MQYKDYYKILGVSKTASTSEIRKAYRDLAKKYHPDRNPGDKKAEEQFKEINEAYQVLNDKEKRARYDQLGSSYQAWEQQGGNSANYNWSDWVSNVNPQGAGGASQNYGDFFTSETFGGDFSDFFSQIFGGIGNTRKSRAGAGGTRWTTGSGNFNRAYQQSGPLTQEHNVTISLEEAFHGTERILEINSKRIEAKIPAGAKTGTKIRLAGVLDSAGRKGDLILVVEVKNDPRFERKNDDLYMDVQVDLYTAVLGGESVLHSLDENLIFKVPSGTQPDQLIRLSGKGMPKLNGGGKRGDLYARIKVRLPRTLNEKQKALFQELKKAT